MPPFARESLMQAKNAPYAVLIPALYNLPNHYLNNFSWKQLERIGPDNNRTRFLKNKAVKNYG